MALRGKQAKRVLEKDNYSCRICGMKGINKGTERELEIHHIFPFLTGRRLGLTRGQLADNRNLITLCVPCHIKTFPTFDYGYRLFIGIYFENSKVLATWDGIANTSNL